MDAETRQFLEDIMTEMQNLCDAVGATDENFTPESEVWNNEVDVDAVMAVKSTLTTMINNLPTV